MRHEQAPPSTASEDDVVSVLACSMSESSASSHGELGSNSSTPRSQQARGLGPGAHSSSTSKKVDFVGPTPMGSRHTVEGEYQLLACLWVLREWMVHGGFMAWLKTWFGWAGGWDFLHVTDRWKAIAMRKDSWGPTKIPGHLPRDHQGWQKKRNKGPKPKIVIFSVN